MYDTVRTVLAVVTTVGVGTMAGVFAAFSIAVMPGLARLAVPQAVAAMQSMNVAILNPVFGLVFGGSAVTAAVLAVLGLVRPGRPGALLQVGAALLFLAGGVVVTMALNVPLNNALAAVDAGTAHAAEVWAHYLARWTALNHVRALTSAGALLLLALSFLRR